MSAEELEELLELYEEKEKSKNNYIQLPDACKHCRNNPKNGGSGACNCTIGLPKITC